MKAIWEDIALDSSKEMFMPELLKLVKLLGPPLLFLGGTLHTHRNSVGKLCVMIEHNDLDILKPPSGALRVLARIRIKGFSAKLFKTKTHWVIKTSAWPSDLQRIFKDVRFLKGTYFVLYAGIIVEVRSFA